jgi:hypothetical protein
VIVVSCAAGKADNEIHVDVVLKIMNISLPGKEWDQRGKEWPPYTASNPSLKCLMTTSPFIFLHGCFAAPSFVCRWNYP